MAQLEHVLQAVDNQRFAALRFQVAADSVTWKANQSEQTFSFEATHDYLAQVGVMRIDPSDTLRGLGLMLKEWSWGPITFKASKSGSTGMPARDYDVEAGEPSNALFAMPRTNTPTVVTFGLAGTPSNADQIFIAGLRPADDAEARVGVAKQSIKRAQKAVKKARKQAQAGILRRAGRGMQRAGTKLWSGLRKLFGVQGLAALESAGVDADQMGTILGEALGEASQEMGELLLGALNAVDEGLGDALDAIENPAFLGYIGDDWLASALEAVEPNALGGEDD